ncbi:MAG: hypothetical protein COA79_14225 [Planctomycetota bacterium]|nr:MAG: hypothetical protein COA79_14225 [Planctomycetota bacterium]
MKIMSIHAHFDDFEFTGGGLFTLWKNKLGDELETKVVVCTNGEAGHHFMTKKETGVARRQEQLESAKIGGYDVEFLKYPNGEYPREGCLFVNAPLLASLWKSIRDFKPDYIFCPPMPSSTTAGIHIDHVAVADAVRKVAYMINVPHCYLEEYPVEDETQTEYIEVPVIINYTDGYMHEDNLIDFAVDTSSVIDVVAAMSYCHKSQIMEWLPWVGRNHISRVPENLEDWTDVLKERRASLSKGFGLKKEGQYECFTLTAWGAVPNGKKVLNEIPGIDKLAWPVDKLLSRYS